MNSLHRLVFVALLVAGLPGCMTWRLDLLPEIAALPEPPPPEERPTLFCDVHSVPGDRQGPIDEILDVTVGADADTIAADFVRSGFFRSVTTKPAGEPADLQLDIVLTASGNDIIPIVSACMLYVIPTWRTVTFDLTAEVRARDGRWQRYNFVDAARDVNWLPLVLIMSFNPWGEDYPDVRSNMIRHLVMQMRTDGFLALPPASPEPQAAASVPPAEP
jgi:hypothetical protein